MRFNLKKLSLTFLSSSFLIIAGCGDEAEENNDALVDGEEITLAYVTWDSAIAKNNVVGTVLEDVGYDVTLANVDNTVMWQAVATGEADAMVTADLPDTHGPQYEEYGDQMVHVGTNLEGARNALVVPSYMGIDSIEDLTDEANQTITGIEAGAGIMLQTENALEEYDNLSDWTLSSSSSGAMTAELTNSIDNQEEIIVTGWIPHWKFLEYDLTMLEDPLGIFGEEQSVNTFVREGFEDEHPVAYSILSNFQWEFEDIESVMLENSEGIEPEESARNFVDNNQELVDEWTAEAEEVAAE